MSLYIETPSEDAVQKYIEKWDSLENYVLQEQSLNKLFFETYPKNNDISEILIKASSLNDFYSTNIFSIFPIAKHILKLEIDNRLQSGESSLVNDIGLLTYEDGKTRNYYSFATKYCSHHRPLDYPIYDSYVERVLMHFKKQDKFSDFIRKDLRNYSRFKEIVIEFRNFYGLEQFNLKDIDRYVWQVGKEYFPNKY
ncbi:hypothetical protein ACWOBX_00780 [Facklamia languida]